MNPPKASKKCLRKLFPFHEYGKVWNARQVIVLTSNQSLTDNAIWKVGRFQGGIQVGKNLLKLTSDKISTIAQHTIFVYFKKKFMKYFKNSMGSVVSYSTTICKTLPSAQNLFLEGRDGNVGIRNLRPRPNRLVTLPYFLTTQFETFRAHACAYKYKKVTKCQLFYRVSM